MQLNTLDLQTGKEVSLSVVAHERTSRIDVMIDPSVKHQKIIGLGAALTDSSAWLLWELKIRNPVEYENVMRRLFSKSGAGLSVLRIPMGASDYTASPKAYTYADMPSFDLSTFSIEHDRETILPVLRDVLILNPSIHLIASPWSAPAWMKQNGRLDGVTQPNRLKPGHIELYADYLARFVQAYAGEGVRVHAMTLQNEPQFDAAAYPCMRMTVEEQALMASALDDRLRQSGHGLDILIHDHNWVVHSENQGVGMLDPLELVQRIYNHPTYGKHVAGSAWHCYAGGEDDMRHVYQALRRDFPSKKIYGTEASGWREYDGGNWLGDLEWGLRHDWLGGLIEGACCGMQWNLVLDQHHGPSLRDDSLATGLATINTENWTVEFEREFYPMALISKAVPCGSTRIQALVDGNAPNMLVLAVERPDKRRAVVIANFESQPALIGIQCEDSSFQVKVNAYSLVTGVWHA